MKQTGIQSPAVIAAVGMFLAGVSFSLACVLTSDEALTAGAGDSVAGRLLGESRRAIGQNMAIEADRYFHRGVGHQRDLAFVDFIQRLKDEVQPRTHEHLVDEETLEMMPWLRMATRIDPHNVEAYLGAAFWVAEQDGYLGQAMGILDEARKNNPDDYRVALLRGQILLHHEDLPGATRAFDRGLRLWPRAEGAEEEQKKQDLASLLNYRGFLHELEGRNDMALACYHGSFRLRPGSEGLEEIIREVEIGGRSREDLDRTLEVFYSHEADPDERCPYSDEHDRD